MRRLKKILAAVLSLTIISSFSVFGAQAKVVSTPADVSGWTYLNGAAYDEDAAKITCAAGQIQLVTSTFDLEEMESADVDFGFTAKFTAGPAADWRAMIFLRDQNAGKPSWDGERAADDAYLWLFGNGAAGLKDAKGGDLTNVADREVPGFQFTDGEAHTYRFVVKTEEAGIRLQLYIDGEKKVDTVDEAKTVADKGQITMVFAGDNQVAGEITDVVSYADDGSFELTESMGKVDLLAEENFGNIKYGQGAAASEDHSKILLRPISDTVMTNSRIYVENIKAKDVTLNFEMQSTAMPANLSDWMAMVFLRDQAPGNASWERGGFYEEGKKTAQGYCVVFRTDRLDVLYVDSVSQRNIATAEYPEGFSIAARNAYVLDVHEVNNVPVITMSINGAEVFKVKAEAAKDQILTAGGVTIVGRTDVKDFTLDITKLSLDLAAKSTTEENPGSQPDSKPDDKPDDKPATGDAFPAVLLVLAGVSAAGLAAAGSRKARR